MRWIVYLVLGLVVAGCGEAEPVRIDPQAAATPTQTVFPSLAPQGEPLPVRVTKPKRDLVELAQAGNLPDSGSFTDRVIDRLERDTTYRAGFAAKTTGHCAGGRIKLAPNAVTICSVTYRGKTVKWRVVIGSDYKAGNYFIEYDADQLQAVLLREAVHTQWYKVAKGSDQLRCSAIPAIQVVPFDEPTTYRCQKLVPQAGTEAPYWQKTSPIRITELGIDFYE
jgi:hypothetical protein